MNKKQFLDITGLQNYDSHIKSETLLRQCYDLTQQATNVNNIVGNMYWDESKSCYSFEGDIQIYLPRTASVNVFIFFNDKQDAVLSIGGISFNKVSSCSKWLSESKTVSFGCSAKLYIRKIIIEETSYKIPTKVSELENDKHFVSSTVVDETLTLSSI